MIALLAFAAHAITPALTVGADAEVDDIFIARRGPVLGTEIDLGAPFSLEGMASWYPNLGDFDYTVTTGLLLDDGIAPDISRVIAIARAGLVAWPLRHASDRFSARVGLAADAALVCTQDDPVAFGGAAPPDLWQNHPTLDVGLRAEAWGARPLALRVRVDRIAYRETFGNPANQGWIERRRGTWLGIDLVWRP